ncbi:MAG: hypothetical protein FOGNACKC_05614 [Anaerolineae bacterium]|nr:hypothetical protein [Anaerolineae bacterium]
MLAAESPLAKLRKITGVEQSGQCRRGLLDFIGGGGRSIGLAVLPNKPFAADGPGTVFVECVFDWGGFGWRAGCKIGGALAGEAVSRVKSSFGRVAIEPPLKRGVRQESFGEVNGAEDSYFVGSGQSAANSAAHCPRFYQRRRRARFQQLCSLAETEVQPNCWASRRCAAPVRARTVGVIAAQTHPPANSEPGVGKMSSGSKLVFDRAKKNRAQKIGSG